jgi:hypothetical protein
VSQPRWIIPTIVAAVTMIVIALVGLWIMTHHNSKGSSGALPPITSVSGLEARTASTVKATAATKPRTVGGHDPVTVPPRTHTTSLVSTASTTGQTAKTSPSLRSTKSSSNTTTTRTSPSEPGQVPWVKLYNSTQDTLDVDWGLAPGATRYQLSWVESGADGRTWRGVPPAYTDYKNGPETLINLKPGRTYTVTVTPFNGQGSGPGRSMTGKTTAGKTTA